MLLSNEYLKKIASLITSDTDQRINRLGEPGPSAIYLYPNDFYAYYYTSLKVQVQDYTNVGSF